MQLLKVKHPSIVYVTLQWHISTFPITFLHNGQENHA